MFARSTESFGDGISRGRMSDSFNSSGSRINHSIHCPDGRQTTFEEAFSQHRLFIVVHLADSDVPTTLRNLRDAFGISRWFLHCPVSRRNITKLRFISGPFPLSNSRHGGKMDIDTTSSAQRSMTAVRHNVKPVTPLKR